MVNDLNNTQLEKEVSLINSMICNTSPSMQYPWGKEGDERGEGGGRNEGKEREKEKRREFCASLAPKNRSYERQ